MNKLFSRKFEIILIVIFFVFSSWLMNKSFGYDSTNHIFRVARNEIGDFGLHLSLIRSFSWGNNFPPELPFYPNVPLPYHYFFDLIVGLFERLGITIDVALNGLSALFFTTILYFIYKLPQVIFRKSSLLGLISVFLFAFHSSFSFVDFLKGEQLTLSLLRDIWRLPDYIYKGPFDGSIFSIYFTFNVFLNQRHLIAALAISLVLLYILFVYILPRTKPPILGVILFGLILGIISRFNILTFFSTFMIITLLLMLLRKIKIMLLIIIPALFIFSFHLRDILGQSFTHQIINVGFLAQKPITFKSLIEFWFLNLGIAPILMTIGIFLSGNLPKKFFLSIIPLFILGNVIQFSFRLEHNHPLFNYFILLSNFYIAFFIYTLWTKRNIFRVTAIIFLFLLTFSGFLDLMAIKNDYQYKFSDAPKNKFMNWIKNDTGRNDIFISNREILDPVTLSGRKNYLGHDYYLSVMGYDYTQRAQFVKNVYETSDPVVLNRVRREKISYIVVPLKKIADFNYKVNITFLKLNLKTAYTDENVIVFKL